MKQKDASDKLSQSVADFYEEFGAAFSSTRHAPWGVMRLVMDSVKPGDILVDVGAGNGRLGLELDPSVRYIAVEPSSKLREAAQTLLAQRLNKEILAGGFPDTFLGDTVADSAACLAVLHHLPTPENRQDAVNELARILKSGGMLVLSVWNPRSPRFFKNKPLLERLKILTAAWLRIPMVRGGGWGDVWVSWKAEGADAHRYVHAFTLKELKSLFDEKAWEVQRCEAWDNQGVVKILEGKNLVIVAKKL